MRHVPLESEVLSKARSAGTLWVFSNKIKSPTRIEEYGADLVCGPPSRVEAVSTPDGSRMRYLVKFASLSHRYRL